YGLVLPPLFPLLRTELGVSYAALGVLITASAGASALSQPVSGFLVDRFGARRILLWGLPLLASAIALAGIAPSYGVLVVVMAAAGLGNGVFHPADYSIFNAAVHPRRLGRAYSAHSSSGSLGWVLAPIVVGGLTAAFGWRIGVTTVGLAGVVVALVLSRQRVLDEAFRIAPGRSVRGVRSVAGAGLTSVLAPGLPPTATLAALLALIGFAKGATNPSRDLLVRGATPSGASGRVFGFVYSGLDVGTLVMPPIYGWLIDRGEPRAIFFVAAALMALTMFTVLEVGRRGAAVRA